jgi:hypothetical protein
MKSAKLVPYLSPFQKSIVIRGEKTEIICFLTENNKIIALKMLASHTSVKQTVQHKNICNAFFAVETEGQHTSKFGK